MIRVRPRASALLYGFALVTGYLAVVAWLTWPLLPMAWSSLPAKRTTAPFDLYYSAWVLAHESHALVSGGSFADANIFHPADNALFYGPIALGALPLFAPVFLTTGNPTLAINVTFLLGVALTGVAMHVVVRRWTSSELAGVIGAATVIFNAWMIRDFVPSTPHWAAVGCLPLIAFFAATRLGSMRSALLLAPLVALQSLTEIVYVAPALFGVLGVLAVLMSLRSETRAAALRLIAVLALAAVALLPPCLGYLDVRAENPDLVHQTIWQSRLAIRPAVLPDRLLHGSVPFLLTPAALGLVVLGTGALLWRRRSGKAPPLPGGWAHGALWSVVGGCLSLPPVAMLGQASFRTPLGLLFEWFPSLEVIRVPIRLGLVGLVGLGILSGIGFAEISAFLRAKVHRARVALCAEASLAVGVLLLIHGASGLPMSGDLPLQEAPTVPASFMSILRAGHEPLLEVTGHAAAMFHSISHWRPLLNGYSSYYPAGFDERMKEAELLPAQDALDQLVERTGLGLIWVHTERLRPKQRKAWSDTPRPLDGHRGLSLVASEGSELLYAVDPPPASSRGE